MKTISIYSRLSIWVCLSLFVSTLTAEAQITGSRSLGTPLRRGTRPGSAGATSVPGANLSGAERFIRGNRGMAEFVGSDRRDTSGFVGNEQARPASAVVSSTTGLRERTDRTSQINRPLTQPDAKGMYHPNLSIDFSVPDHSLDDLGPRLTNQLSKSSRFSPGCRFEVSVVERTAILKGEVSSARERDLAEIAILVEPGISTVKNEIVVANDNLEPIPLRRIPDPPIPQTGLPLTGPQ
ncbi:MAG: BON domain-containing protein [Planctomycetes bacterium]|nr:BON domain-containing protein [Planctomycetota bacterium]